MSDATVLGTVEEIWVYPVRALRGARVPVVEIDPPGLRGDRVSAVVDAATGTVLRAKDEPGLAAIDASGDPTADERALREALGRPVRLEPAHPQPGAAPVHLVSRGAIARAAAGEVPEGCSAEDPRANLVLSLAEDADERTWVGRTLRIGQAVLEVTRTPKHCLGVYAEVRGAGAVAVGDAVLL